MTKDNKKSVNPILAIFVVIAWIALFIYARWYFKTGWDQPNAIMKYCAGFNDPYLGWFPYVFGHGVLNFVAGYGAVFAYLAPILLGVLALIHGGKCFSKLITAFFAALIGVVVVIMCLYSIPYFLTVHWLLSGLFILISIFAVLASCVTVFNVVIIIE
jgi:hypothetical protein